jgi:gamma-glutamyl:cysteine ligase YbdK (ATP-grasp superfamily)
MKDRALRRHQDLRAKRRSQKVYNSCIGEDLPQSKKERLENNVEKLKKVCVMSHHDRHDRKAVRKTLQEMKHDITMEEQLRAN